MKIAYLLRHNLSLNDGVTKKIFDQVNQWKNENHNVEIFCYTSIQNNNFNAHTYNIKNSFKYKFLLHKTLIHDLKEYNPDIIYYRYSTYNYTLSYILKKYMIVVEINSDDLSESYLLLKRKKNLINYVRYYTFKLFRSMLLQKVKGMITVTKEISSLNQFTKYSKPITYIPNGIDLIKYQVIKENTLTNRIGLFFMGSPNQPWHGIDLIIKLSTYLPQYDFHIIGIHGENKNNLYWHGYLEESNYIKILKKCHICIGTLALYRKNMKEACPLKVREYLAYGYPTIINYKDTAFIENEPPFLFNINNQEFNLTLSESINKFIIKYKDYKVSHVDIQNINIKNTEIKRLNFFHSINKKV